MHLFAFIKYIALGFLVTDQIDSHSQRGKISECLIDCCCFPAEKAVREAL
jgi:hypothetical protein